MAIFSSNFLRLIFQIILLFSHPNFYYKSNKHKTLINRPRTHTRRDQFFKELQCRDFRLKVISSHMKAEISYKGNIKGKCVQGTGLSCVWFHSSQEVAVLTIQLQYFTDPYSFSAKSRSPHKKSCQAWSFIVRNHMAQGTFKAEVNSLATNSPGRHSQMSISNASLYFGVVSQLRLYHAETSMNPHEKPSSSGETSNTMALWIFEVATAAELQILVLSGMEFLRCVHRNENVFS